MQDFEDLDLVFSLLSPVLEVFVLKVQKNCSEVGQSKSTKRSSSAGWNRLKLSAQHTATSVQRIHYPP